MQVVLDYYKKISKFIEKRIHLFLVYIGASISSLEVGDTSSRQWIIRLSPMAGEAFRKTNSHCCHTIKPFIITISHTFISELPLCLLSKKLLLPYKRSYYLPLNGSKTNVSTSFITVKTPPTVAMRRMSKCVRGTEFSVTSTAKG